MREIDFSVVGYPPAKNEAKSMLAAGHYVRRPCARSPAGGARCSRRCRAAAVPERAAGPRAHPRSAGRAAFGRDELLGRSSRRARGNFAAESSNTSESWLPWPCTPTTARSTRCATAWSAERTRAIASVSGCSSTDRGPGTFAYPSHAGLKRDRPAVDASQAGPGRRLWPMQSGPLRPGSCEEPPPSGSARIER